MTTLNQKMEREREEVRRRMAEKDKLLSKRALQINTLQGTTQYVGARNSSFQSFTFVPPVTDILHGLTPCRSCIG